MKYTDRKQIMQTLLRTVHHIYDKEYQKRAWIRGEEADFDESVCIFFDIVDDVLNNYRTFQITDHQYQTLKKFSEKFKVFSEENNWPPEFIDTPEWNEITEMAKEVLKAFNYDKIRTH